MHIFFPGEISKTSIKIKELSAAEKRIKEEEDEADYDDDYEQWRSQSEKEDAQIDEMFGALRWN